MVRLGYVISSMDEEKGSIGRGALSKCDGVCEGCAKTVTVNDPLRGSVEKVGLRSFDLSRFQGVPCLVVK